MVKFSNPRLQAEFDNWPIGSGNVGLCRFVVEDGGKKGQRVARTTTNKYGQWCKPKLTTYESKFVIVDGDDNKTYLLNLTPYGFIKVTKSDLMQAEVVHESSSKERYEELKALFA